MRRIIQSFAVPMCLLSTLTLSSALSLPQKYSAVSKCPHAVVTSNKTTAQIHPYKVIVKPWWGRHHVYAIFVLPSESKASYLLMVTIQGSTYCGWASTVGNLYYGIYAKPGERIVVGRLRTRTAVWLIVLGFIDQLKESHNWTLISKVGY